jgi:uncharacterized protein YaaW (UPF0174 family)
MDELRKALELATDEELQQLTKLLFERKFNPLDYFAPQPIEIQSSNSSVLLDALESRFRYLASDGVTVLRGRTKEFSYRDALIKVCHFLKIPYSKKMTTTEIESEIFLELISKSCKKISRREHNSINQKIQNLLASSSSPEPIPSQVFNNPLNLILKGSGAFALSAVLKPWLLRCIARQVALHIATYQATQTAIATGGSIAVTEIGSQLALQMAKREIIVSTASYGAARSVLAIAGPILWGCFLADLGWRSISTNYSRVIPMIFTLAQIRLTRGNDDWEIA